MNPVHCCTRLMHPSALGINRACLTIQNHANMEAVIHTRNEECFGCDFDVALRVPPFANQTLTVDTVYPLDLGYSYFGDANGVQLCANGVEFQEAAWYHWDIHHVPHDRLVDCHFPFVTKPGKNIYMPLVVLLALVSMLTVVVFVLNMFVKKSKKPSARGDDHDDANATPDTRDAPLPSHLGNRAADTFAGLCLLLIMFFNYNEPHYAFARHTVWDGVKFPDLMLPWLLWLCGFHIGPTVTRALREGTPRSWMFARVCATTGKLLIIGLMVSSVHHTGKFEHLPFVGPLQMIAVVYFFIATIETIFCSSQPRDPNYDCMIPELAALPFQWIVYVSLLTGYLTVYLRMPAPGCPRYYFGAGGAESMMMFYNCTGGLAGYVDRIVLGGHIDVNLELLMIYGGRAFNKYGLLPCVSASLAMFMGYITGLTYFLNRSRMIITLKLILGAIFGVFLCSILCGFNRNLGIFPLNYNLMSISLMLLAGSTANLVHLALTWVIDWLNVWDGKPFYYLGKNVLLIYVLHMVLNPCFPIFWITCNDEASHCNYIVMSTWAILLLTSVAAYLHGKKIFIRI